MWRILAIASGWPWLGDYSTARRRDAQTPASATSMRTGSAGQGRDRDVPCIATGGSVGGRPGRDRSSAAAVRPSTDPVCPSGAHCVAGSHEAVLALLNGMLAVVCTEAEEAEGGREHWLLVNVAADLLDWIDVAEGQ